MYCDECMCRLEDRQQEREHSLASAVLHRNLAQNRNWLRWFTETVLIFRSAPLFTIQWCLWIEGSIVLSVVLGYFFNLIKHSFLLVVFYLAAQVSFALNSEHELWPFAEAITYNVNSIYIMWSCLGLKPSQVQTMSFGSTSHYLRQKVGVEKPGQKTRPQSAGTNTFHLPIHSYFNSFLEPNLQR